MDADQDEEGDAFVKDGSATQRKEETTSWAEDGNISQEEEERVIGEESNGAHYQSQSIQAHFILFCCALSVHPPA
ncbi:hypothetical protein NDU88_000817 [Pleurodeles waltl]|uniref:Uncharacterized protein n=1 Tax=Pleurodeles waltl TaxID=8319 RepID=A0AAV7TGT6_PLEWA|nr:hypothetical protein NDU88_000817 [Pleurodeles waltl]